MASPELRPLQDFRERDLERGARHALQAHPHNALLLSDWLFYALATKRQREASEQQAHAELEAAKQNARSERQERERAAAEEREAQDLLRKRKAEEEAARRVQKHELKRIRDAEDEERLKGVAAPTEAERAERHSLICHGRPRNSLGRCNSCGSQGPVS